MATGPRELLTQICTLDDVVHNAQVQQQINNEFYDLLSVGGGGDTYKVAVDLTNIATADYLDNVLLYVVADGALGDYPDAAIPVVADVSSTKERLQVDVTQLPGWDPEGDLIIRVTEGVASLDNYGTVSDNYTVKITLTDTVPSFLWESFDLNETYVSGADMVVAAEVVGSPFTDQTLRPFVDVSAITGYSDTDLKILGIDGNVTQFFDPTFFSTVDLAEGLAIDITEAAGTFTISVDLTEISGYDATKNQLIWNNLGGIGWTQANLLTVKIPTTIEVSVVGTGPYSLRVKLNYQNYQFFGKTDGSTGSIIGDLTLTDVTVNNPTAIELNDLTTSLQSKLVYTPKTLHLLNAAADGASTDFNDSVTIDDCN